MKGGFIGHPIGGAPSLPPTDYRVIFRADSTSGGTVIALSDGVSDLATASFTWSKDVFYWTRLRTEGTSITAKVWAVGTTEPGSPQLSATDSGLASGKIALSIDHSANKFAAVSVATGGPLAPWPPMFASNAPFAIASALAATVGLQKSISTVFAVSSAIAAASALYRTASAELAASSVFASSAFYRRAATAAFAASSELTLDAKRLLFLNEKLAGASTLSADLFFPVVAYDASALLAGTSNVAAAASIYRPASALLSSVSTLSSTASLRLTAAATFPAASALLATARLAAQVSATLPAAVTLAAGSSLALAASAALTGTGTLVAASKLYRPAFARFDGSSALSATVNQIMRAAAAFAASNVLAGNATLGGAPTEITSLFVGSSTLSASTRLAIAASARLGVSLALAVDATALSAFAASALFSGNYALVADALNYKPTTATLTGSVDLAANGNYLLAARAELLGAATLQAATTLRMFGRATLAHHVAFIASADLKGQVTTSAALRITAAITASTLLRWAIRSKITGSTSLSTATIQTLRRFATAKLTAHLALSTLALVTHRRMAKAKLAAHPALRVNALRVLWGTTRFVHTARLAAKATSRLRGAATLSPVYVLRVRAGVRTNIAPGRMQIVSTLAAINTHIKLRGLSSYRIDATFSADSKSALAARAGLLARGGIAVYPLQWHATLPKLAMSSRIAIRGTAAFISKSDIVGQSTLSVGTILALRDRTLAHHFFRDTVTGADQITARGGARKITARTRVSGAA